MSDSAVNAGWRNNSVHMIELWARRLSYALAWIGAVSALLMALNVIVDVIGRTFFAKPLPGTLDLITFWWMPLTCLLPLALAEAKREHISVNVVTEQLPGALGLLVQRIGLLLTLAAVGSLVYFAGVSALEKAQLGERALSVTWLPVWPMRFVVMLALFVWFTQLAAVFISTFFRSADVGASANNGDQIGGK